MPTSSRRPKTLSKNSRKNKGLSFPNLLAIAFFLAIVPLSLGILYITILNPRAMVGELPDVTSSAGQRRIRVLDIRYFPPNTPYRNDHSNPELSVNNRSNLLRNTIINASKPKGYKNPSIKPYIDGIDIVATIIRNEKHPVAKDGPDGPYWYYGLKAILEKADYQDPQTKQFMSPCDLINDPSNRIDQVWIWKDVSERETPNGQTWDQEFHWVYPDEAKATFDKSLCNTKRTFGAYSFDMTLPLGFSTIHSFGHSIEHQMSVTQGQDLFWNRWTGSNGPRSRASNCGNVHFPPNTAGEYDYTSRAVASTSCENWKPDGTGAKTNVSCELTWSCQELAQDDYHTWWLQNMPFASYNLKYENRTIPTWWDFMFDFEANLTRALADRMHVSPHLREYFRPTYLYGRSNAVTQRAGLARDEHLILPGLNINTAGTFVFVTYRDPAGNASVNRVTLGNPQVRVSVREMSSLNVKQSVNEYRSEVWWLKNPPVSAKNSENKLLPHDIEVFLSNPAEDLIVHTVTVSGIDFSQGITGFGAGNTTRNYIVPVSGTNSSTIALGMIGAFATDPRVGGNTLGVSKRASTNIQSSLSILPGQGNQLEWVPDKNTPWVANAVVMKLLADSSTPQPSSNPTPTPQVTANPTPTPQPSSNPTPTPQVTANPTSTPLTTPDVSNPYRIEVLDKEGNRLTDLVTDQVVSFTVPSNRYKIRLSAPASVRSVRIAVRSDGFSKSQAQRINEPPFLTKNLRRRKVRHTAVIRYFDDSGAEIKRTRVRYVIR